MVDRLPLVESRAVPGVTRLPGVPAAVATQTDLALAGVGQATSQVAVAADTFFDRRRQKKQRAYLAEAVAENATGWEQKYREAIDNAPSGAAGLAEALDKTLNEDVTRWAENVDSADPETQALVRERLGAMRSQFVKRAIEFESVERSRHGAARTQQTLQGLGQSLLNDPSQFKETHALGRLTIDEADDLRPAVRRQLQDAWRQIASTAALGTLVRQAPETAMTQLEGGKWDQFLEPTEVLTWIDRAETSALAQESDRQVQIDRLEKQQEKAIEEAQELRSEQLRIGSLRGELGQTELIDALERREITRSQFNSLLTGQEAVEVGEDNAVSALELRQRIYDGLAGSEDVFQAHGNGDLSAQTAEELINLAASERQESESVLKSGDAKRARQFLDAQIGGVRGPLAVLDFDASARLANALREFDTRVTDGEEPFAVADGLAKQFRQIAPAPTSFGTPMFLVGTMLQPDVAATEARTLEALDAGQISEATAARELQRIQAIDEALNRGVSLPAAGSSAGAVRPGVLANSRRTDEQPAAPISTSPSVTQPIPPRLANPDG